MCWHRTAAKPLHHLHRQQDEHGHQIHDRLVTFTVSLANQNKNSSLAIKEFHILFPIKNFTKSLVKIQREMKSQEKMKEYQAANQQ